MFFASSWVSSICILSSEIFFSLVSNKKRLTQRNPLIFISILTKKRVIVIAVLLSSQKHRYKIPQLLLGEEMYLKGERQKDKRTEGKNRCSDRPVLFGIN